MNSKTELSKDQVIQLINHIGDQEKHFNGLETQYRLLASTWLLACLGAIGYLLQTNNEMMENKWLLIALIGIMGCIGIFLLWILDIKVYHRLLHCVFLNGIKLEQENDWLPKIRTDMLLSQETGDVTKNTGLYYVCSCVLLITISLASFCNFFVSRVEQISTVLGGIIVIWIIINYMRKSIQNSRALSYFEKLKETYKDELIY